MCKAAIFASSALMEAMMALLAPAGDRSLGRGGAAHRAAAHGPAAALAPAGRRLVRSALIDPLHVWSSDDGWLPDEPDLRVGNTGFLYSIIQMAIRKFEDTFACVKFMVPRHVFDMARRLCSSPLPNVCKSGWVSEKPNSVPTCARTVSEFNPGNSIRRSPGLTENESQLSSDPDSFGKTPATWVISAAAPHHATGNRSLLSGFITKHDDLFVHAVDETPMQVVARGTVATDAVALPDVWLVPGLTVNLLSVSQLVGLEYSVEFGRGMCYIRRSASDGTIIGKAHLRNRLYVLDFLKVSLDM